MYREISVSRYTFFQTAKARLMHPWISFDRSPENERFEPKCFLKCFPQMESVGASGDDALRTSVLIVLTIRPAKRYISEMTSRLC